MSKTVMIIDDEMDIRAYLVAVLEDNGYATCVAEADEDVVQALRQHQPDLVLLDIMMPGRSGLSIYREIRAAGGVGSLPVAMISGLESPARLFAGETGDDSGAQLPPAPEGFIEKPIKIDRLIEVVEALVSQKEA